MVKCAVLRDAQGIIIGVMRGNYTLMPNWLEEADIDQNPPPTVIPPTKRVLTLKDQVTGLTRSYDVISDEAIPI